MVPSVIDYLLQLPEAMHFARVQELCGDGVFFYRMLSEYGNGTFQLIEFEDDLLLILIGDYTPKDTFEKITEISEDYMEISQFETDSSSFKIGGRKKNQVDKGIYCYLNTQKKTYTYCEGGKPVRFTKVILSPKYFNTYFRLHDRNNAELLNSARDYILKNPSLPELNFVFQQIRDCQAEGHTLKIYLESKVMELLSLVVKGMEQEQKHISVKLDYKGIYQTVILLSEHEDVREFYQNKYKYLLVDEYQDTSVAQFRLVSLLTGPEKNICVVGDDDQSIYRFRGATIENILNFERIYKGTRTIRLEQNYRSTSNILNAANCVIQHNTERKGKTLWTKTGEGDKVQVYTAENEQDEASHIADVIGQHLKEGGHLADHAIRYRMNAQSAPIESYFTRAGIPHKIVGGQRFNDRKEVKDIHSYMSIVANPRDDVRLRRIINEPARKIGATTIEVIADLAAQQGISMLDVISHADQYAKLSRAIAPLFKFWDIYQKLQESLETKTLDEFASDVIEITGYRAMLEADAAKGHEDAADRLQNLGQLVNNVKSYCDQHGEEASLEGYLEDIALISDIDSYNESADQVVLMTIHSAKGLEFPYVFLIGMEEGVFPSEMSKYSEADLEEERRLAYVGITRAKKELYISNSVTRMLYGRTQRNEPSRFLREIEPEYIEETRSPVLEQRSRLGGWGSGYGSDTVPGGASGYSGPSGWGRAASGYGSGYGSRSGYLNKEYNAPMSNNRGFGSDYAGRGSASSGHGGCSSGSGSSGFGSGYGRPAAPKAPVKPAGGGVTSSPRPAAASTGPKHYEPGDIVEHKVFGRGKVLKVKPAAGDQIVEISFEKVGVKKTMANFAPLVKITTEE